jgi:hypothetical protein
MRRGATFVEPRARHQVARDGTGFGIRPAHEQPRWCWAEPGGGFGPTGISCGPSPRTATWPRRSGWWLGPTSVAVGGGPVSWLMPRWAAWRCRYNAGVEGWCARPWTQYLSAGKIATWLSKMTLQAIASVRVHDEFQRGSAGEARSRASAAVVIQLGGVRRHVGPRPLPPDGRDRHHRRCE